MLKKIDSLIWLFLFIVNFSIAQNSIDLSKTDFEILRHKLAKVFIKPENRTIMIKCNQPQYTSSFTERFLLNEYRIKNEANIKFDIIIEKNRSFVPSFKKKFVEKKDDKGNVVSKNEYHYYSIDYEFVISVYFFAAAEKINLKNEFSFPDTYDPNISFNSKEEAEKHLKENTNQIIEEITKLNVKRLLDLYIAGYFKDQFAYYLEKYYLPVYYLDNEKDPEYLNSLNYRNLFLNICGKYKVFKDNTDISEIKLYEDYYNSILNTLSQKSYKEKDLKKVKFMCYNNLGQLAFLKEDIEAIKKYGALIIENDYNNSIGNNLLQYADDLIYRLKVNNLSKSYKFISIKE